MDSLFKKWASRKPEYSIEFQDTLFKSLSKKYGAEGDKKRSLGKHFSNNYELYIYAFFLGLYNDELKPIPEENKRVDFSYAIQYWGSKKNSSLRKDFSGIQQYIFTALVAKTDIDLIALDKGKLSISKAVRQLLDTMESYTNGGLILLKEKLEDNPNYYLRSTAFLDMIVEADLET